MIEVQAREQEQKQMEDEIRQKEEALKRLKETLGEKNKRAQEIAWASEAEESKKARTSLELLETRMREAEARQAGAFVADCFARKRSRAAGGMVPGTGS